MTARTSACVLALLLPGLSALSACSGDGRARVSSDELVIGVSGTDPGLALVDERDPRLFTGFEVDLASYVADGLGWDAGDVSFVIVDAADRETVLESGTVDLLLGGEVDAVTTDDALLAGHAAQHPDALRVVGSPFSTIYYDIGLPEGSPDVAVVDGLLARAAADGTWQKAVDRHLGTSGYTPPLPPAAVSHDPA